MSKAAFFNLVQEIIRGGVIPKPLGRAGWSLSVAAKAIRVHQWVKNLLIFVPIVVGGAASSNAIAIKATICFFALCLLASSSYLINDILDLSNDRLHASKRSRPLASGAISVPAAIIVSLMGVSIGLGISALLGVELFLAMSVYLVVTLAYSLRLSGSQSST